MVDASDKPDGSISGKEEFRFEEIEAVRRLSIISLAMILALGSCLCAL